jgi:NADH:ubiquinone oxidoreductase subunit K
MSILNLGILLGISLFKIGLIAFIYCGTGNSNNLIKLIIALELLLLAIGLIFAHYSFILDDFLGTSISFYLLPLAGAESAILLSVLLVYYPKRSTLSIA